MQQRRTHTECKSPILHNVIGIGSGIHFLLLVAWAIMNIKTTAPWYSRDPHQSLDLKRIRKHVFYLLNNSSQSLSSSAGYKEILKISKSDVTR